VKDFAGSEVVEGFAGSVVERFYRLGQLLVRDLAEVGSFGEILP
jgi:hypothetical protein